MNYRHAYHAGNHADVLKHAILARLIDYLAAKDKPFAVLDAHAGIGAYDLLGPEASKTDEWQGGIGLMRDRFDPDVEAVLRPYRKAIETLNADGGIRYYPGSPDIILQGLRAYDRLIANELHPQDAETLRMNYAGERRLQVSVADAWQSVKAHLPFQERRGLVLIDPPYEVKNEKELALDALRYGMRRFANGIFLIWYPVKGTDFAEQVCSSFQALGIGPMMKVELRVRESFAGGGLAGSGLIIVNPTWGLESELKILVPALATRLGIGTWGHATIEWLVPPKA